MTKKAVVLAAGRGGRLQGRGNGSPKCLLPVAGRPLIHHVLTSLANAGLREAVLVLGHCGEQIEEPIHVKIIRYETKGDIAHREVLPQE